MQAQINLLRMQGHTITETDDGYLIDGKVEVMTALNIMRDAHKKTRIVGFRKETFAHRLKRFLVGKENLHDLVYVRAPDDYDILMSDKPYAVCMAEMKKQKSSGNFKNGVLKIVQL